MNFKKIVNVIFLCLTLCVSTQASAYRTGFNRIYGDSYVVGFGEFDGDRHGDFKGDITIRLNDGSVWKVHPDDLGKIFDWNIGDEVYVSVRTSFYWFKREHKFLLCNTESDDEDQEELTLRVMIVKHGHITPVVEETSDVYSTGVVIVEDLERMDRFGRPVFDEEVLPGDYKKDLLLSDGTDCTISEYFDEFTPGTKVYFGQNIEDPDDYPRVFLITGTEREAIWTWIDF